VSQFFYVLMLAKVRIGTVGFISFNHFKMSVLMIQN